MATKTVTDATFATEVLQAPRPVLVDFTASWCGPCKAIAPVLDELAEEQDEVTIAKLDVDQHPEIASQYSVMGLPTLILFQRGEVKQRIVGTISKAVLINRIQSALP